MRTPGLPTVILHPHAWGGSSETRVATIEHYCSVHMQVEWQPAHAGEATRCSNSDPASSDAPSHHDTQEGLKEKYGAAMLRIGWWELHTVLRDALPEDVIRFDHKFARRAGRSPLVSVRM